MLFAHSLFALSATLVIAGPSIAFAQNASACSPRPPVQMQPVMHQHQNMVAASQGSRQYQHSPVRMPSGQSKKLSASFRPIPKPIGRRSTSKHCVNT